MPRLSVWLIRCALVYLALGLTFGAVLLISKGGYLKVSWVWRLLLAHREFLLMGWVYQLAIGVGFWILPRFPRPPIRGKEGPVWVSFVILNSGILLVVLGHWYSMGQMALTGQIMEAGAILGFMINAWPRIKAFAAERQ